MFIYPLIYVIALVITSTYPFLTFPMCYPQNLHEKMKSELFVFLSDVFLAASRVFFVWAPRWRWPHAPQLLTFLRIILLFRPITVSLQRRSR